MKHIQTISKFSLFVLAISFLMTGCLSATHPLPKRDHAKGDSPLVGYWHGVISNETQSNRLQIWSVYHFGGRHFSVVMSNKKAYEKNDHHLISPDEDTSLFDMDSSLIGDDTYLTLKGIRGTDIKDYLIVKYEMEDGKLTVWNITDEAIKRGVESNQLRARREGGSYTITSKSSDMGKWIESLSPLDYELYGTFERSDLDPRELTHRLLSLIPSQS
jgi:hypothetical protein